MLPSVTLLARLKRNGRDAAYRGTLLTSCPFSNPVLKQAWEFGWYMGERERREEMRRGTHPDITYSPRKHVGQ